MTQLSDLSPEQREVVDTWGKGLAVLAGAGSGKTTTLVMKCLELLKRKPEARLVAVSFTERSASDIREKLSARLQGNLEGHWVMTIHGLCGTILREYPREAGMDGDEKVLTQPEANMLWESAIQALWFDELTPEIEAALHRLLARESRDSLLSLLVRVRDLQSFGVVESLLAPEDPDNAALGLLGRFVFERYDRLKKRRGAIDFNDLERGADRALENLEVQKAFHQRFDLVLVDEFQDTNPLQARILWRFAKPDLSNLCVVGDPKQSIYRFRDADVTVFEDCCAQLSVRINLSWNFRSRPEIIEFANQVCGPLFEASNMHYDPLVSKRETKENSVRNIVAKSPLDLANWVNNELRNGAQLHDMALLLRKIRGADKWLKAFSHAGIPIAVGSGGLFWEDPRIRELVAFLKWWENPGNNLSGAVFLRAPWVGITDATLDAWSRQDPTFLKPFLSSGHLIANALSALQAKVLRPAELLMALLVSDEIEQELGAPLLGLWHRAEELSSRGLDYHSVVAEFAQSITESRREREVPPPKNQGQLLVLTLHSSKGLEFPTVILLDFPEKPNRNPDAPLMFWDRQKGAYLGKRDLDGERDKKDPAEIAWRSEENFKAIAESKRLFYVALTRARETLLLVYPENEKFKPSAKPLTPDEVLAKDFWRGWIEVSGVQLRFDEVKSTDPSFESAKKPALTPYSVFCASSKISVPLFRPRHSVTEWNTLSRCERAYDWSYAHPKILAEGIQEIGLYTGAKPANFAEQELSQRELGTRVHACLETGDFDGLKALEAEAGPTRFLAEPVMSWALSSAWMAPEPNRSFDREAWPEREVWPDREVWTELSFEIPIGNEVVVGSMDRLVKDRAQSKGQVYTLIDFKVTDKPKSVEGLFEAYATQMELYSYALYQLEPEAKQNAQAVIVNISARTIQEVPLPMPSFAELENRLMGLSETASSIVAGRPGIPKPGPLCRYCEFKPLCPEADRS